jgi:hypothetical protein
MHGAADRLVQTPEAEAIYAALAGPKRWELFDAAHQSYCIKCPERWTALVREFLEQHLK